MTVSKKNAGPNKDIKPSSVRIRLILLVLFSIIPALLLLTYNGLQVQKEAKEQATENLTQLTQAAYVEQERFVEAARQLLISMSLSPAVIGNDSGECNKFLADLLKQYPLYANLGVIKSDGDTFCSGLPTPEVNLADRLYFRKAVETGNFAIGEYQIGRITKKASINFGYPVNNSNGEIEKVVFAALDLAWINNLVKESPLFESQMVLTVFDNDGTVLVHSQEPEKWIGQEVGQSTLVEAVMEKKEGVIETRGLDDVLRLYSVNELGQVDNPGFIAIGLPRDAILAKAEAGLVRSLLAMGLVGFLALILAWYISKPLIVRQIEVLQEIDRLKDEFISLVSHQLKTPAAAVKGFLFLVLKDKKELDLKQVRLLTKAYESNEREIRMVDDLLNVSRIESGRMSLDKKSFDLSKLIDDVVSEQEKIIKDREQELVITKPNTMEVNIDADKIKMVIGNLLDNASKYTPEKGIIEINLSVSEIGAKFSVKDTGKGMGREDLDKLFTKFSRLEPSGEVGGTGLGLYIAKKIIELHGGSIKVFSEIERGSEFVVELPN